MLARSRYLVLTFDFFLPLIFLLLIGFGLWYLLFSPSFAISEIVCTTNYKPCANDMLLAEASRAKASNIFRYQETDLEHNLRRGDFSLREVVIKKQLPNKLILELTTVAPTVALQADGVEDIWAVCDQMYRVLELRLADPNVPTLIVPAISQLQIGKEVGEEEKRALELVLAASRSLGDKAKDYTLINSSTVQFGLSTKLVLLNTKKDPGVQLASLQAILADSTIKAEAYDRIDLRFDKPILRQN